MCVSLACGWQDEEHGQSEPKPRLLTLLPSIANDLRHKEAQCPFCHSPGVSQVKPGQEHGMCGSPTPGRWTGYGTGHPLPPPKQQQNIAITTGKGQGPCGGWIYTEQEPERQRRIIPVLVSLPGEK